ncbi:Protein SRG1 [Linum perenne]
MADQTFEKYLNSSLMQTSVQELAKTTPISVPRSFRHETPPHLSTIAPTAAEIPTLDFHTLSSDLVEDYSDEEVQKLHFACKEWGIFQIVNHGIDPTEMEKLRVEIEGFYELPLEEKMKYRVRGGEVEGYGGSMVRAEGKMDWGDRLYMTTNPKHLRRPHLLPELPCSFRETLEEYLEKLQTIGMQLLSSISKALNIEEENEMTGKLDDGLQSMRITYYPPCPQPEMVLGFTPHSDATCITILNQVNGVGGLQIKQKDDDGGTYWIPVTFRPHALLVLVGDILEVFSNGEYESVEHRVTVNPDKERISMAFFVNPKLDAEIRPAAKKKNSLPARYKSILMDQYVKNYFSRVLNGKTNLDYLKILPSDDEKPN